MPGGLAASLPADVVVAQTRELAAASGALGMVGGQAIDLAQVGRQPGFDELTHMHRLKTGALILSSVRIGALAGRPSPDDLDAIDQYGRDIGLAFQIQDDVLDETGDSAVTGKTSGADRERGKPTFTSLLGVDAARAEARRLVDRALAALDRTNRPTHLLCELAQGLIDRKV